VAVNWQQALILLWVTGINGCKRGCQAPGAVLGPRLGGTPTPALNGALRGPWRLLPGPLRAGVPPVGGYRAGAGRPTGPPARRATGGYPWNAY